MKIPKRIETKILGLAALSGIEEKSALNFAVTVLQDRGLLKWKLSRLSRHDKQQLISAGLPGLEDRIDVWLHSRLNNAISRKTTIMTEQLMHEVRDFFNISNDFYNNVMLRKKIVKVREIIWNQRKYAKRKLAAVLKD